MKKFVLPLVLLLLLPAICPGQESTETTEYVQGGEVVGGWGPWHQGTITQTGWDVLEIEGLAWDGYWDEWGEQHTRAIFTGYVMEVDELTHTITGEGPYVVTIHWEFVARPMWW